MTRAPGTDDADANQVAAAGFDQATREEIRVRIYAAYRSGEGVEVAAVRACRSAVQGARGLGWPEERVEELFSCFVDIATEVAADSVRQHMYSMRRRPEQER